MGKVRTKVIETALEPEKVKEIEKLEHPSFEDAAKEIQAPEAGTPKAEEKTEVKKGKARYRSVRYKKLTELIDPTKNYPLNEAVELVKKTAATKFEEKVEAHINLNLQADKQEHQIRTHLSLPKGIAKKQKIVVFSDLSEEEIKKAGAEKGTEATLKEIEAGKITFDKALAEPSWMPQMAKVAKVLGPKGLMPSPKSGTVTDKPLATVAEFVKGRTEIRTEKNPVIHTVVGSNGFSEKELEDNLKALVEVVRTAKPEGLKKQLIKSLYLKSTMGPSIRVDINSL